MNKCATCEQLDALMELTLREKIKVIMELYQNKQIALYAGDGYVENLLDDARSERYFVQSYYFRCKQCNSIYYLGICMRGAPVFKKIKDITKIDLNREMNGRYGEYFNTNWKD